MLFDSLPFIILFLVTFGIYYIPYWRKYQVIILILASFIFYAWNSPQLLILLLTSIFINGLTSFKISQVDRAKKIKYAWAGIIFNLLLLSTFKYGNLVTNLIIQIFGVDNRGLMPLLLTIPLPIGISFYTFESISLLIDTFKMEESNHKSDENLKIYFIKTSLFICFFPHLIAGPILKASYFYPQIKPKYFSKVNWYSIFRSLTIGYFLKMAIADNLKDYTFWIAFPYYQNLSTFTGIVLLFGYSIQIFADFAGYSSIAIGSAAVFGYDLPQNFNFPYISRSLAEFWSRWHISLSSWLKDYLYIPLGGNRKGQLRTYLNLIIVMVLGGLWHGAAWSYALWGAYHGLGLAIERLLKTHFKFQSDRSLNIWLRSIIDAVNIWWVFCFVSVGWLFFKLPKFDDAVGFIKTMSINGNLPNNFDLIVPILLFSLPVSLYHFIHSPWIDRYKQTDMFRSNLKKWKILEDIVLGIMLATIVTNSGTSNEFIYFQF